MLRNYGPAIAIAQQVNLNSCSHDLSCSVLGMGSSLKTLFGNTYKDTGCAAAHVLIAPGMSLHIRIDRRWCHCNLCAAANVSSAWVLRQILTASLNTPVSGSHSSCCSAFTTAYGVVRSVVAS